MAYVSDEYIAEITRNIFNLFVKAKVQNLLGITLLIDVSKAFDRISFELNITTMINSFHTPRIKVGRGCRQGDLIASYLFILCIEILLLKLNLLRNLH